MNIELLEDRVLIEPDKPTDTTSGGIIIPDNAKAKAESGTVVAVGEGKVNEMGTGRIPISLRPGDKIFFGKYGGLEITLPNDDKKYIIMREADIFGIYK